MKKQIDPTAIVEEGAEIGEGTKVWHWTHIMPNVKIGKNCTIGQNVFIQDGVEMGDNCKIQNNVSVYKGVILEDDVFVGPAAVFTNVRKPRADTVIATSCYAKTIIRRGTTIGANATIVCGVEIGENAMIGAGAVIAKNIPPNVTVVGNPAGVLVQDVHGISFVISLEDYYIKKRKRDFRNNQ